MEHYANSLQHVLAELERLDLFIRVQVWRVRQLGDGEINQTTLHISEQEIDRSLENIIGRPLWRATPLPSEVADQIQSVLDKMAAVNHERRAVTIQKGLRLRLNELTNLFGLSQFDIDVLLVCLAPELDLRYTRLYSYLQGSVQSQQPTVDLLLSLFCLHIEDRMRACQRLSSNAPLRHFHLLHLRPLSAEPQLPFLAQSIKLDERIRSFLLDRDEVAVALLPYVQVIQPAEVLANLYLPAAAKEQLQRLVQQYDTLMVYLQGPYGVGKQTIADALCHLLRLRLLVVNGSQLAMLKAEEFHYLAQLADREARLQGAALYWQGFDALLSEEKGLQRDSLLALLSARSGLTFLSGNNPWEPTDRLTAVPFIRLELSYPDDEQRRHLWARMLNGGAAGNNLADIADKFRFTPGQIRDAAATAYNLARWRNPQTVEVTNEDIYAACRLHSNPKLSALAQKITPHYNWSDVVLPPASLNQLQEMCRRTQYRSHVYQSWGFGAKMALGKGLTALFTGPPGTGKTMAADIIAGELGLDLYKIDLSIIVSKYIGETEKNLSRIFAEAETSHAILFFDEADALFGKRTEVKDAHDRYANLEISYLLQKMEEYEGIVILTTNLRQNMDEAFVRRMHFIIEFPFPTATDRGRIWQGIWPPATPLHTDVDLAFMAERIPITGGSIRNIALAAAFLAAAEGGQVTMAHLVQATEREYQKMGRLLAADEFGPYRHLAS